MKKIKIIFFLLLMLFVLVLLQLLKLDSNYISLIYILPGIIIGFILAIVIHELGHLVFGLLSGYKFTSFTFLFLKIQKKDKIKMSFEKFYISMPGQCLMKPTNRKYFLYNIGGLLFSYLFSLILIIVFFVSSNIVISQLCFGMFIINSIISIINSIYSKEGINDISNIIRCKKHPEFLEGMLYQLDMIANITVQKKFKSNYNPKDDVKSLYSNISIWRIKYYKAFNDKNEDKMQHYYDLIKKSVNKIQIPIIKLMCIILLLNHDFIIRNDLSLISRRMKNISKQNDVLFTRYKKEYELITFYRCIINEQKYDINKLDILLLNNNDDLMDKINDYTIKKIKRIYIVLENNNFKLKSK